MPLGATFDPQYQATGRTANQYIQGLDAGASLMDRAQARRLKDAEETRQQAEFQAKMPVLAAAAQADLASAHASVENAARMERLRTQAANESKGYNDEFLKALALPSFEDQARALSGMQAKVAYMDVLPEYKGFVTAVNNATVKAHASALADRGLNNKLDQIDLKSQYESALGKQKADMTAAAQVERDAHAKEIAAMRDETMRRGQDATAKAASERNAQMAARPANQAAVKANEATLQVGQAAAQEVRNTERALQLMEDPALRTGTGAQFELAAQRLGGMLGVDTGNAKDIEQLQSLFGDSLLAKAKQLKGNFSDRDREFIDRISPTVAKTTDGNRMILKIIKEGQDRQIRIARIVNQGRQDGLSDREIQLEVNDAILNNPNSLESSVAPGSNGANPQSPLQIRSIRRVE